MFFDRFFPKAYVDSIHQIDYKALRSKGIHALIFDIDNTLVPHYIQEAPKEIVDLFKNLKDMGFKICLLSNNNAKRVTVFNQSLNLHNIPRARKPFLHGINKAIHLLSSDVQGTAIIGDQIFTDVWCGNRRGVYTILVKPIVQKDELSVFWKRGAEKVVLQRYLKNNKK